MKRKILILGISVLLGIWWVPAYGESMVLYDDFSEALINPDKWLGEEANTGLILRENVRQISRKALDMKIVGYGNTGSNTGSEIGTNSIIHAHGELVNDISAVITVKQLSVSACESNSTTNFARARLTAPLFNVGTPVASSAVDDIYAQFRVLGTPDQQATLKVIALVQRCTNSDCSSTENLLNTQVLTIGLNEPIKLRIKWNKSNNTITFYYNKISEAVQYKIYKYTYTNDNTLAGVAWRKRLDVSVGLANCTDADRPQALIEATFDNVYVNESAAVTE